MKANVHVVLVALGLLCSSTVVTADSIYSGSSGNLSASAQFSLVGSALKVVFTNTSQNDALVPADVLTALFFDMTAGKSLTKQNAVLTAGSRVLTLKSDGTYVDNTASMSQVGREWAYKEGIAGPGGTDNGISSVGLSIFGSADRFDTSGDYTGPESPNGFQFGLLPAGDNLSTHNGGMLSHNNDTFIQKSVTFNFLAPSGFSLSDLSNVRFQYGTSTSEPSHLGPLVPGNLVAAVPLPMAAWGGIALFGVISASKLKRSPRLSADREAVLV